MQAEPKNFRCSINTGDNLFEVGWEDSGGRRMGRWVRNDGEGVSVFLERRVSVPESLDTCLATLVENIPTDEDVNRSEEIRTMRTASIFHN